MYRIVLPSNIDIIVVSYGGVGTSFLINFLSKYKITNSSVDSDGFKHLPLPPISFNRKVKFVYIYGNPQMAAVSLFRRKYHFAQSRKLQRWINKDLAPIPLKMTLQEYAALGVDRFLFEEHFFNWYEKYLTGIPTLFVRYENIFDNVSDLLDFAEIPVDAIKKFPQKKKRKSTQDAISQETANLLDKMYGDFAKQLREMNDIEVRQSGTRSVFSPKYLDKPYRNALAKQTAFEAKELLRKHTPMTFAMLKKVKGLSNRSR